MSADVQPAKEATADMTAESRQQLNLIELALIGAMQTSLDLCLILN